MTARKIYELDLADGKKAYLYGKEIGDQEIYIDGAWGLSYSQGICKLNLFTVAPFQDDQVERREVAARITMNVATLFALKDFFDKQCKVLEDKGVVTSVKLSNDETADNAPKDNKSEN